MTSVTLALMASCAARPPEVAPAPDPPATAEVPAVPTTASPPESQPSATTVPDAAPVTTATITPLPALVAIDLEVVAEGIAFPVGAKPLPERNAFVIVAKRGALILVADGEQTPWLDITDRVRNSGEQGLLDVAFSADFASSGRLFVHYTDRSGDTVLSEFREADGSVDAGSEVVLFTVGQPAGNHNGGALEVAPDGSLLLALGDGGGSNDRYGNGQRADTALGALLRFDVTAPGRAEPAVGNPFPEGEVPELWAFGLRNPWRLTIDGGLLYIADVGQNLFEEINVVRWDQPGVNFGWPITEGLHCFSPSSGCVTDGLTLPVLEIAHGDEGTCSITGGVVYRGTALPEMLGHYLFSDYCGGYLRSLAPDGTTVSWTEMLSEPLGRVTGFGVDEDGEILVANADGAVFRLIPVR